MLEKPQLAILNREEAKDFSAAHFAEQIELLRDLTNYGSNLVIRAFNSSNKDMPAVIVCGVLLKQIVAMLDAAHTLVAAGSVNAAFLPARAAFEASLYLDWILFSDADRKATAYLVSNYRDERVWIARVTKGTTEEAVFDQLSRSIGLDIHAKRPTLEADAEKHLLEVNRILSQPGLAEMDAEFTKLKGKRPYDPEWYNVCGVKSIRQIAIATGRQPEHEFFYSRGSQVSHTASYKDHLRFAKKKVHFKPVRGFEHMHLLINFMIVIALRAYQNTLKFYRPGEIPAFTKKYLMDWRKPFFSIKNVTYKYE